MELGRKPTMERPVMERDGEDATEETRRRFVAQCGRFALAAPPTLALLLATTDRGYVIAGSYGHSGGSGDPYIGGDSYAGGPSKGGKGPKGGKGGSGGQRAGRRGGRGRRRG